MAGLRFIRSALRRGGLSQGVFQGWLHGDVSAPANIFNLRAVVRVGTLAAAFLFLGGAKRRYFKHGLRREAWLSEVFIGEQLVLSSSRAYFCQQIRSCLVAVPSGFHLLRETRPW
jgi:hypothetical protein